MNDRFLIRGKSLDKRGKELQKGDWVMGAYSPYCANGTPSEFEDEHGTYPAIYESRLHDVSIGAKSQARHSRWVRVDPSTIGQCTGLKDCAGELIFEGDIIQVSDYPSDSLTICVTWYGIHAGFNLMGLNTEVFCVVGNIYDETSGTFKDGRKWKLKGMEFIYTEEL